MLEISWYLKLESLASEIVEDQRLSGKASVGNSAGNRNHLVERLALFSHEGVELLNELLDRVRNLELVRIRIPVLFSRYSGLLEEFKRIGRMGEREGSISGRVSGLSGI